MTDRIALVELDWEAGTDGFERAWNGDPELAGLGRALPPDRGGAVAFPLDPASLALGFVLSVVASATYDAVKEGVCTLLARRHPDETFDVTVETEGLPEGAFRVKVRRVT